MVNKGSRKQRFGKEHQIFLTIDSLNDHCTRTTPPRHHAAGYRIGMYEEEREFAITRHHTEVYRNDSGYFPEVERSTLLQIMIDTGARRKIS